MKLDSAQISSDSSAGAGGNRAVGRQAGAVDAELVDKTFVGSGRSWDFRRRAAQWVDRYCSRFDSRRVSAVAGATGVSS